MSWTDHPSKSEYATTAEKHVAKAFELADVKNLVRDHHLYSSFLSFEFKPTTTHQINNYLEKVVSDSNGIHRSALVLMITYYGSVRFNMQIRICLFQLP